MAGIEKQVKARQQQKTDTFENWQIAGENGFIPKKGEVIIYQNEGEETLFKIGDGNTNILDLEFFSSGVGEETDPVQGYDIGGEIFNDYTNNQALGKYSHVEGYDNQAMGDGSHAEGYENFVNGIGSHVEGYRNKGGDINDQCTSDWNNYYYFTARISFLINYYGCIMHIIYICRYKD